MYCITWEAMFPQEVLDGFEEETGIKIIYSNFDTDETMLEKLAQAEGGDYDVVIADDYILETVIQQELARSWTRKNWRISEISIRCIKGSSMTRRMPIRFPMGQEFR